MAEENKNHHENSTLQKTNRHKISKMKDPILKKNGGSPNSGGNNFYWIYAVIILFLLFFTFFGGNFSSRMREVPMNTFEQEMLAKGDVLDIVIVNKEYARITINPDSIALCDRYKDKKTGKAIFDKGYRGPHFIVSVPSVENFLERIEKVQNEAGIPKNKQVYARSVEESNWIDSLSWILPIVLLIIFWSFVMRRMAGGAGGPGQIFSIGKSRATLYDKDTQVNVTFDDVAGLEGAKLELKEIVDFLKNPKKYTELGAKIPKGALLVGPPGTGKTLLAKAVAGEAKVPFFSLSGSDFVEMFVGVGASRVRDLFRNAKEKAPCIVFIDEIDAVGRARGKSISAGANDERESTLNQLLTEMDGFSSNSGIIVLAATNRADILDKALLRAGRFDRQIYVDMPDLVERKEIFKVHLKKIKYDDTVDVDFLARQIPGFSGADIANICNEAALIAARKNKKSVSKQDFLDAVDRIIAGLEKKNKIITKQEKEVIAFHEAGHATVSWMLEHASPLVKVTIVPRGRSLGAAWYLPEERQITTTEQILDEMTAALGGRAAEEIIIGKISTGALSDLEKVTKQAYASVMYYGLNEKIGNISYYDSSGQYEFGFTKPYSEYTAQIIDQEVKKMVDVAYARAKAILQTHKDKLKLLAQKLLEKEVIFKEDLEEIFGKRPFEKEEISKESSTSTPNHKEVPNNYKISANYKHIFFKILFLFFFYLNYGQDTIRGTVYDEKTGQPLPYVQIGIISKKCGTVSDEKGRFTLIVRPEFSSADTLIFRMLSYRTLYKTGLKEHTLRIFMQEDSHELTEVEVRPKKIHYITLGNKRYNKHLYCYFSMKNEGESKKSGEAAIKANNKDNREVWLDVFHFYLISNPKKDTLVFRLNFYAPDKNNYPGPLLNSVPVVFKVPPQKTGIVDVDIKKHNLHIKGDFFIAVEVLTDFTEKDQPSFSGSVFGPVYLRKNSFSPWEKYGVMGLDFNVDCSYMK